MVGKWMTSYVLFEHILVQLIPSIMFRHKNGLKPFTIVKDHMVTGTLFWKYQREMGLRQLEQNFFSFFCQDFGIFDDFSK